MDGFASFDDFIATARIDSLVLSPDGSRLVATVSELAEDGDRFVSALWELDPAGETTARRLTRSDKGEKGAAFPPDGSVLFVSGRGAPTTSRRRCGGCRPWARRSGCSRVRVASPVWSSRGQRARACSPAAPFPARPMRRPTTGAAPPART